MAIDTRDKRASCLNISLPWRGCGPTPDGSFNQGDRQQIGLVYRGIAAGASSNIHYGPAFVRAAQIFTPGVRIGKVG